MGRQTITYDLSGRLGNHLQLWACARTLSIRNGWDFEYQPIAHETDFAIAETYPERRSRWNDLGKVFSGRRHRLRGHEWHLEDSQVGELLPNVSRPNAQYVLDWSAIYTRVDEFRPQLIRELLGQHSSSIPRDVTPGRGGVHIRRGDGAYLMPMDYYARAIKEAGLDEVHLFSDGPLDEIVDELGTLTDAKLVAHHGSPVEDMLALASYSTIIMSFSWFSYWAAFLSHDATVYAPRLFSYYPQWIPFD
ncbi:alpha-1,2-fucosyltransferase [Arthrobacter sp. Soil762]|uniref:alpha-1,2-fucosyltransferase n=1 Tax=Arthrobacter sp. Soil762 TaxID=1736401 RepID=UPI0006FC0015|nr:alpha-1,2-fucosyltransferase [Arthrobacter sp. Soil762]KRE74497.1 hypothetical protein ASG77_07280 [Arthrobacter sp. Soil762]